MPARTNTNNEAKNTNNESKRFKITIRSNPTYCGIDAGSVQFANGTAIIPEGRMVDWFKEHDGYEVVEVAE